MITDPSTRKGMLIVFEGIDGSGKTTQVRLLAEELRGRGLPVVETREPTDGVYGRKIRELFNNRKAVSREEELALFMDDRREHVETLISPALESGKIVVTDRYYFSTAAYQGAEGLDPEEIIAQNELFAPVPDLVILVVITPDVGTDRVRYGRGEQLNDFERKDALLRVSNVFDAIKREYIVRVDGSMPLDEVHKAVMEHVGPLLDRFINRD